jgi:hypothetical protein
VGHFLADVRAGRTPPAAAAHAPVLAAAAALSWA